jgi:FkbM family methyltransferase
MKHRVNIIEEKKMKHFNTLSDHPLFKKIWPFQSLQDQPLGFIDVGARGGAHELASPLASMTAVLGFEPDEKEHEVMLQNQSMQTLWAQFALEKIALAEEAKDAKLHLLSAPTNHSLLPPNEEFTKRYSMVKWIEVGASHLKTEILDTILFTKRSHENYWGEFIKLDTQGTEYEILKGSKKMLTERTVAIVTEVSFCELYRKQKLFSEIELFLRDFGFAFYGFYRMHLRSQRLLNKRKQVGRERAMYADAVFFKDPLPGSFYQKPLSVRQSHVLFVSALLLKYYDFALELATKTWGQKEPTQLEFAQSLIADLSAMPYEETVKEILHLTNAVHKDPGSANIYAGKFVDKRRIYHDYDDVQLDQLE